MLTVLLDRLRHGYAVLDRLFKRRGHMLTAKKSKAERGRVNTVICVPDKRSILFVFAIFPFAVHHTGVDIGG
jgi:hypothetical protein